MHGMHKYYCYLQESQSGRQRKNVTHAQWVIIIGHKKCRRARIIGRALICKNEARDMPPASSPGECTCNRFANRPGRDLLSPRLVCNSALYLQRDDCRC